MDLRHVLLTRYNVPTEFNRPTPDPLDADWLHHRNKLFRRFCLPSIERQTTHDFEWFIFFDPATPRRYYKFLDGFATVILTHSLSHGLSQVRDRLTAGPVLSTRIDNDDAIAPTFMAGIRSAADGVDRSDNAVILAFRTGVFVNLKSDLARFHQRPNNPFQSLIDFEADPQKVTFIISINHTKVLDLFPSRIIETDGPMWMRVLHDRNVVKKRAWSSLPTDPRPLDLRGTFPGLSGAFPATWFSRFLRARRHKPLSIPS